MAYQPNRNYGSRSPILDGEPRRSPWISYNQVHQQHNTPVTSSTPINFLDPESEDSDVSNPDGDIASAFSFPINLPPAPSKQALENPETISAHLHELERVEDHNVRKHNRLKEKRKRKDERIARKRAVQDAKIKAIMDARARRDSRINLRRQREDIAFTRFYETLEEEETRLRQRLKRLKRGLPLDDSTLAGRRVSVNSTTSTSPRGLAYSTIPPPAKRHQTSHPSQTEYALNTRAPDTSPYPPPPSSQPSYQFYPSSLQHPSSSSHYQPSPAYPPAASPPIPQGSRSELFRQELPPYAPNGQRDSTHLSTAPPPNSTPNAIPPRHPSTSYDTRPPPPPPPPSSGFATVNQPASSGFAAVNLRSTATPPIAHATPTPNHAPEQPSRSTDQTPSGGPPSEDKSTIGGNGSSKRTPSTTHPYQMSEAFANRHHHCKRIDSLNRGIWTWYGHGGTRDNPTALPAEMYLKCNHEGCGRIDWRTVHGLQCHIVKNHEQPKGTIGSLEKALARYGVPVGHIEEIEKRDGIGAGGTMADPKNTKIKSRMRESGDRRDLGRKDHSSDLQKFQRSHQSGSPSSVTPTSRLNNGATVQHRSEWDPKEGNVHSPIDGDKPSVIRPLGGFAAINSSWQGVNSVPTRLPGARDHEPKDARTDSPKDPHINQRPPSSGARAPFWPSWQAPNEPLKSMPQAFSTTSAPPHQQTIFHETTAASHEVPFVRPGANVSKEDLISVETVDGEGANANQEDGGAEKENYRTEVVSEAERPDVQMSESAADAQDTPVAAVMDKRATEQIRLEALVATEQEIEPATPEQSAKQTLMPDAAESQPMDNAAKKMDEMQPIKIAPQNTDDDAKMTNTTEQELKPTLKSPEPAHKRVVPSRRESRRSSLATAASNKIGTEKAKEEDNETISTANTASKADSVDYDSDSITVAPKPVIDRQKEREKAKEGPKRQANGRFVRKEKR